MFAYCNNTPILLKDESGEFLGTIIGGIIGGISGGIIAAINGDNVWAGIGIGAATGAFAGLAVDFAVATGGIAGIVIAAAGGAIASGGNYAATETVNKREVDIKTLAIEATVGAVFNLLSFGVNGGSMAKAGGSILSNMKANCSATVFANTTRKVAGEVVKKTSYGVFKNVSKNIGFEVAQAFVIWSGQFAFAKIFER